MAEYVAHMGMACRDPVAIESFYTKHFGFRRARVLPVGAEQIVMIRAGNFAIELFKAKEEPLAPPAGGDGPWRPGWRHLAIQVDDVDAKLAEMGDAAKVTLGPMGFDDFIRGWRTAWLADPEGNIIEISQGYVDQESPPPLAH